MYNISGVNHSSSSGVYGGYGNNNVRSSGSASSVSLTPSKLDALNTICHDISSRTKLSTTGYQSAMGRLAKKDKTDDQSLMTMRRAQEYTDAAKMRFSSSSPLAGLARLQKEYINNSMNEGLVAPIHMSESQLTECLEKCRNNGFSNCDMQALEVAIHLRHKLGVTEFNIVSNSKLSHNYVTIDPSDYFPKGAIIDTWTGQGFIEQSFKNKLKFEHKEKNLAINQNMQDWVEKHGARYVMS